MYLLSFSLLLSQPINHIQLYKKVKVIYVENSPSWDGLPFILLNQKELYNSIGMTTNNTNKTLEKYTMHIVYVGSKPKAMTPFNLKTCVMLCLILKSKVKLYQNYTFSYQMHNSIMNSSIIAIWLSLCEYYISSNRKLEWSRALSKMLFKKQITLWLRLTSWSVYWHWQFFWLIRLTFYLSIVRSKETVNGSSLFRSHCT